MLSFSKLAGYNILYIMPFAYIVKSIKLICHMKVYAILM